MSWKRPWAKRDEIWLDGNGFDAFIDGKHQSRVNWREVRGIAAFKRDLFSVDEICLAFVDSDRREYKTVAESMERFEELSSEIARRYPDHDPEWWHKVVVPAFSTCWTVVWGEAPEAGECPACGEDITGSMLETCPRCGGPLGTRPCPECHGRGAFFEWWWKWVAVGAGLIGLLLAALPHMCPESLAPARSALHGWGAGLLGAAALCALFAVRYRAWPCTFCEQTGWWDPRGRAARRIPPAG